MEWRRIISGICIALVSSCLPSRMNAQSTELGNISALIRKGKLQEAERQLQQYLVKRPHSATANYFLGSIYLQQGNLEQAERALQKSIAISPNLIDPRLVLGDAYVREGKLDLALAAYKDVIKIAPHDARSNLALAKLYLQEGEFAKSLEAAGDIPLAKRTAELLPTLAADYFGLQQPEKAGFEIQGMLQVAKKQPDLVPELAELFLAHHDFTSAQQLFALAQGKQPATDRFLVDQARTQAGLGQLDEAQKTLEGVLEHAPGSLDALLAAGQVASQQSDWVAAAEAFSRAASLAPRRADILYGLASAQLYANQRNEALKNAQELHALVPDDLRSSYLLALALFGEVKLDEAKVYAEQVLATHPEDREMNLILVDIAFNKEHDLASARKHVDICLKQNQNDPGALYYLGMIQKMEGDVSGALKSLSASVASNPKNSNTQGALGALCLQAGDVAQAAHALEQAVLLAPEEEQNHYELALAYSRLGAPEKAKSQLQLYEQIKAKQAKEAKGLKGPSTSEIPPMGIPGRP